MTQKYEKVDLGNVKGKNGQDGIGIEEFRFITDIDPTTHLYHVVYTDEGKAPTEVILHDGDVTIVERALENYIQKSNTNGLLKNDGTVDTTTYSTFDGSYDNLLNPPNIPSDVADLRDDNNTQFTPRSHTHGYLNNDGQIEGDYVSLSSVNFPIVADYSSGNSIRRGMLSSEFVLDPQSHETIGSTQEDSLESIISKIDTFLREHNHNTSYYTKSEQDFIERQTLYSNKVRVFSNAWLVYVVISGTFNVTANSKVTFSTELITDTYRPKYNVATWSNKDNTQNAVGLNWDGSFTIVNNTNITTSNVHTSFTYPLKSKLPS